MNKTTKKITKAGDTTAVLVRLPKEVHLAVRHRALDAGLPLGTVIAQLLRAGLAMGSGFSFENTAPPEVRPNPKAVAR